MPRTRKKPSVTTQEQMEAPIIPFDQYVRIGTPARRGIRARNDGKVVHRCKREFPLDVSDPGAQAFLRAFAECNAELNRLLAQEARKRLPLAS